jgi:hypothetical protein
MPFLERRPLRRKKDRVSVIEFEAMGMGLLATVIFFLAQVVASMLQGEPATAFFRAVGSVFLGHETYYYRASDASVIIGALAGLAGGLLSGFFFGLMESSLNANRRCSRSLQAGLGALFGALLWALFFQVIGRFAAPWILAENQAVQLFLFVVFFGAPLGLLFHALRRVALRGPQEPIQAGL